MRVTVLGCGNSTGVPLIGCECAVCRSTNQKNKRSRVSVLVEEEGVALLIDSSPDLREQALKANMKRVDAVLYTHAHADHANGIDDLRAFNWISGKRLPVYGSAHTMNELTTRFPYVFSERVPSIMHGVSGAWLAPNILPEAPANNFNISGISVGYFEQIHGKIKTYGYRIGKFAYSTDLNMLPETAFQSLKGVEVWLVDCLKYTESFSHSHLALTLQWVERVKPRLAILTHMNHDFDYEELSSQLPSGVIAGYDGMVLEM